MNLHVLLHSDHSDRSLPRPYECSWGGRTHPGVWTNIETLFVALDLCWHRMNLLLLLVVPGVIGTILVAFVIVPEILERRGYNPRSARSRAIVWLTFLAIVLTPAAATGFLFSVTNLVDWLIFAAAISVAVLYDYYRLNPSRIPWQIRSR